MEDKSLISHSGLVKNLLVPTRAVVTFDFDLILRSFLTLSVPFFGLG